MGHLACKEFDFRPSTTTQAEGNSIKNEYFRKGGFPSVIGCIVATKPITLKGSTQLTFKEFAITNILSITACILRFS